MRPHNGGFMRGGFTGVDMYNGGHINPALVAGSGTPQMR
jgi:hypothetical protein